jgi:hypothetical protein
MNIPTVKKACCQAGDIFSNIRVLMTALSTLKVISRAANTNTKIRAEVPIFTPTIAKSTTEMIVEIA